MPAPLHLLLGPWDQPFRDGLAIAVGLVARATGADATAYWTAPRGGGIFARHGASVVGGRHHEELAHLLATRPTTLWRCAGTRLFGDLVARGGARVVDLPAEPVAAIRRCIEHLRAEDCDAPRELLALPTTDLPEAIAESVVGACAPLAWQHGAWPVPLEASAAQIRNLAADDSPCASLVVTARHDAGAWHSAIDDCRVVHEIDEEATPEGLAFGIADALPAGAIDRWLLAEPVLAAERLPGAVLQRAGIVCAERVDDLLPRLAERCRGCDQEVLVARYGGGRIGRLSSDAALYPLFRAGISVQVEEPGRPAFPVTRSPPPVYPRAAAPPDRAAVGDDQLRAWAAEKKFLLAVVTHSGERSHDECLPALYESAAFGGMPWGIGTHRQRVEEHPTAVEPMLVAEAEGGVRERCECVLHSAGDGIIAERVTDPRRLAARMAANRDRIAGLVGAEDAPRGVLCYADADVDDWQAPAEEFWRAVREEGFAYVLSTVAPDADRLLYRDGDFVVLPCAGPNSYPYSPFIRVHRAADLIDRIDSRQQRLGAAYMVAVIDLPVLADPASLLHGDRYRRDHPTLGPLVRACTSEAPPWLVATTPAVVARYAALLDREGG